MLRLKLIIAAAIAALVVVAPAAAVAAKHTASCTVQRGQSYIDSGRYDQAIREFTCVISADPTAVEGYRGRIEAELLLGRYSDGLADWSRVTAFVVPVDPDAHATVRSEYADRLAVDPDDVVALTGAVFERWSNYDYPQAIHLANRLLAIQPNGVFGNLFRGSSRLLHGTATAGGVVDIDRAISLAPTSPDVRFVTADAYTYGFVDLDRAFAEASLALDWGLGTPRIHAILATAYTAFGDTAAAASHTKTCIDLSTTDLVPAAPLAVGATETLGLVPGRTYEIPIDVTAGQAVSIATSSKDFWDTIAVLLAPDGTPVVGSDDANAYFAAFEWVAPATGTYRLRVTSFESINTGDLVVTRG